MKTLIGILMIGLIIGCSGICLAEGVPILPDNLELLRALDKYVTGTITLVEGWNLIAVPVLPQSPLTVERFIKMAYSDGRQPGGSPPYIQATWRVLAVAVYKNGHFKVYPKEGVTYNMVPGEAYFVYAQYTGMRPTMPEFHPTTTIKIVGKPVNESVSLNLNRGWNGVSLMRKQELRVYEQPITELPKIPPFIINESDSDTKVTFPTDGAEMIGPIKISGTLSQLSRELIEQGVKANRIVFWNAYKQEWVQHQLPFVADPPTVEPFLGITYERLINASEGFFLLCSENGLYLPGLDLSQNPPLPKRILVSGKIEGIQWIPENQGPYNFVLVGFDAVGNAMVRRETPLKGQNEDVEALLAKIADGGDGNSCTVEGVMKIMTYSNMLPPYKTTTVEVLIVDEVFDVSITVEYDDQIR